MILGHNYNIVTQTSVRNEYLVKVIVAVNIKTKFKSLTDLMKC